MHILEWWSKKASTEDMSIVRHHLNPWYVRVLRSLHNSPKKKTRGDWRTKEGHCICVNVKTMKKCLIVHEFNNSHGGHIRQVAQGFTWWDSHYSKGFSWWLWWPWSGSSFWHHNKEIHVHAFFTIEESMFSESETCISPSWEKCSGPLLKNWCFQWEWNLYFTKLGKMLGLVCHRERGSSYQPNLGAFNGTYDYNLLESWLSDIEVKSTSWRSLVTLSGVNPTYLEGYV
jgi:hypothetical protein